MKYNIKEKEFKDLGYTFQKLYARDYKTYRKEIDNLTIWCWVKGLIEAGKYGIDIDW